VPLWWICDEAILRWDAHGDRVRWLTRSAVVRRSYCSALRDTETRVGYASPAGMAQFAIPGADAQEAEIPKKY